jgi:hypothetical protein
VPSGLTGGIVEARGEGIDLGSMTGSLGLRTEAVGLPPPRVVLVSGYGNGSLERR